MSRLINGEGLTHPELVDLVAAAGVVGVVAITDGEDELVLLLDELDDSEEIACGVSSHSSSVSVRSMTAPPVPPSCFRMMGALLSVSQQ